MSDRKDNYILPSDGVADEELLYKFSISLNEITTNYKQINARRKIIIDF